MMPAEISTTTLSSALEGAKLAYFDGLSLKTALVVADGVNGIVYYCFLSFSISDEEGQLC